MNLIDDVWNIDENRSLRKLERIYPCPHPQQTPSHRKSRGKWLIDRDSSHFETGNELARSLACSREHNATMEHGENPNDKLHVVCPKFMTFLANLKNLTPSFGTGERSREFQWNQQRHVLYKYDSQPPKHRRKKLQCQKAESDPWHGLKGRHFLTKGGRQTEVFESQECDLRIGRDRMTITLQIETFIRGIIIYHSSRRFRQQRMQLQRIKSGRHDKNCQRGIPEQLKVSDVVAESLQKSSLRYTDGFFVIRNTQRWQNTRKHIQAECFCTE